MSMPDTDFAVLTEQWGEPMTSEQQAMARTRYAFARERIAGRDVLEIACGSGFGLKSLEPLARSVAGGDVSSANLEQARVHASLPLVRLDAVRLPFRDCSVDVVVFFEAVYYVEDAAAVIRECRRVVRPDGRLLLCLPNPDRSGFHESPHAHRYFSAPELRELLAANGFDPRVYGGFPVGSGRWKERIVTMATAPARRLGLVPKTLAGRRYLKRVVYGRLEPLGDLAAESGEELVPVDANVPTGAFKNLYAEGLSRDDHG